MQYKLYYTCYKVISHVFMSEVTESNNVKLYTQQTQDVEPMLV